MEKISNVQSLSERLKTKTELDRQQIETMIQSELKQLAINLKKQSDDALNTTMGDIQTEINKKTAPLISMLDKIQSEAEQLDALTAKAWLKPTLIALMTLIGISCGSWGLITYLSSSIQSQIEQKAELSKEVEQLQQTLTKIEAKTWGITFSESKEGKFLILPPGMTAQAGWTFNSGKQQGVKLSKN